MRSRLSPVGDVTDTTGPLRLLVEQLWSAPVAAGCCRLAVNRAAPAGWRVAERYLVLPTLAGASMLLPAGPRPALVGSLMNYRGLRRRRQQIQRRVLGAVTRARLPLPVPTLSLLVPHDLQATDRPALPMETVRDHLGEAVFASIGVRSGANRKATLQLVDGSGAPRGFAKVAWDDASRTSILREQAALEATEGDAGARAPHVIASGKLNGWPFLISEPLPLDARGIRAGVAAPTAQELFALTPLGRHAPIVATAQLEDLRSRLAALGAAAPRDVVGPCLDLLQRLADHPAPVPTVRRGHGDLTPWNCARDGAGRLWCWDWESSEEDVVAGLDPLHWHVSEAVESGRRLSGRVLERALDRARPLLVAAGTPRDSWGAVAAVYALTMAERACSLGAGAGGWEEGWVVPADLVDLLTTARRLVEPR